MLLCHRLPITPGPLFVVLSICTVINCTKINVFNCTRRNVEYLHLSYIRTIVHASI